MDRNRLKIEFRQIGRYSGDCTAPFEVVLSKGCTLKELIEAVISNEREWGYVGLEGVNKCEYRWGKVLFNNFSNAELDCVVDRVTASGGWTRMDYQVVLVKNE